jgi:hypothetical protein
MTSSSPTGSCTSPKLCTVERNDVVQESSDRALESLLLVQPFEHYFGEHSTSTPAVFFVA